MIHNTIDEMLTFLSQRFSKANVRDCYITRAITALKLPIAAVRVNRCANTFIINLNFLLIFHVIENRHLLAADDSNTSYLARVEPADVNIGLYVIREDQI